MGFASCKPADALVLFVFFCTVMDLSVMETVRGVKFCVRVLLSGQALSHFGEVWLAGSHGGGITSGWGSWNWPPWHGHSELGAAVYRKAVWWDLRLASLLMHLFTNFQFLSSSDRHHRSYCVEVSQFERRSIYLL